MTHDPKKVAQQTRINVAVPTTVHRALKSLAGAEGKTLGEVVNEALAAWVRR